MTMGIMIGTWEDDGANPFKGRQLCRRLPTPFMPCSYMQYVSLTRLLFHMQYPVIVTIRCTRRWDGGSGFHTSSHAKHGDRCTSQLCHSLVQVMLFHIISLEILREQANCFILNQHCWFCSMFYRWITCQTMACCRLFGGSKQRAIRHQNGLLESPYLDHHRLHCSSRTISKTFSNGSLNHPWNRH